MGRLLHLLAPEKDNSMPVVASASDAFQVRICGRLDGQETNNVLHFIAAGSIDDVDLRLIAIIAQCFVTHLLPVLPQSFSLERVVWKKVSPNLGLEYISVPSGFASGAGDANSLPSFVSTLISIRTAEGGRSKRGRMYLPGVGEGDTTGSYINMSTAFWAGVIAFVGCIAASFIGNAGGAVNKFNMAVYSRKLGGSTLPYGAAGFTLVTDLTPTSLLATTRSRKVGRGA
jgi:hypothetical protein